MLGVQDLAVVAGEHQAGVDPHRSPGQALLELPDPVGVESRRGPVRAAAPADQVRCQATSPAGAGPGPRARPRWPLPDARARPSGTPTAAAPVVGSESSRSCPVEAPRRPFVGSAA